MDVLKNLYIDPHTLREDGYGIFQVLFLYSTYCFILFHGSRFLNKAVKKLVLIPEISRIATSMLIPMANTVPIALVIISCGLSAVVNDEFEVGAGALVGTSLFLITVPWSICVLLGRVDIDPLTGACLYKRLTDGTSMSLFHKTRRWANVSYSTFLFNQGIHPSRNVATQCLILLATAGGFAVIQIPSLQLLTLGNDLASTEKRVFDAGFATVAMLVAFSSGMLLLLYRYWKAPRDEHCDALKEAIRIRSIRDHEMSMSVVLAQVFAENAVQLNRHRSMNNELMAPLLANNSNGDANAASRGVSIASANSPSNSSLLAKFGDVETWVAEGPVRDTVRALLRPFFTEFDSNGDAKLSKDELRALLREVRDNPSSNSLRVFFFSGINAAAALAALNALQQPTGSNNNNAAAVSSVQNPTSAAVQSESVVSPPRGTAGDEGTSPLTLADHQASQAGGQTSTKRLSVPASANVSTVIASPGVNVSTTMTTSGGSSRTAQLQTLLNLFNPLVDFEQIVTGYIRFSHARATAPSSIALPGGAGTDGATTAGVEGGRKSFTTAANRELMSPTLPMNVNSLLRDLPSLSIYQHSAVLPKNSPFGASPLLPAGHSIARLGSMGALTVTSNANGQLDTHFQRQGQSTLNTWAQQQKVKKQHRHQQHMQQHQHRAVEEGGVHKDGNGNNKANHNLLNPANMSDFVSGKDINNNYCDSECIEESEYHDDDDSDLEEWVGEDVEADLTPLEGDISLVPAALQRKGVLQSAGWMAIAGLVLCVLAVLPLPHVIRSLSYRTDVKPFFVSSTLVPFAVSFSEMTRAFSFAKKRSHKSISVALSGLLGACAVNNTINLALFLFLFVQRDMEWQFGSETAALLSVMALVSMLGLQKVQRVVDGLVIGALFIVGLLLVLFFEVVVGWG